MEKFKTRKNGNLENNLVSETGPNSVSQVGSGRNVN